MQKPDSSHRQQKSEAPKYDDQRLQEVAHEFSYNTLARIAMEQGHQKSVYLSEPVRMTSQQHTKLLAGWNTFVLVKDPVRVFSITTIASSTTIPRASRNENKTITFRLMPSPALLKCKHARKGYSQSNKRHS